MVGSILMVIRSAISNIKELKRTRPSPRKPFFLANNETEIFSDKSDSGFLHITNNTLKSISIQTEEQPENCNEIFRKDSAIDVNHISHEEREINSKLEKSGFILPDRIIEDYGNLTSNFQSNIDYISTKSEKIDILASEWHSDPQKLILIEEQLIAFQESKIRHHKNLEMLRHLQVEIDQILQNPAQSSGLLMKKISEMESLGKDIICFNHNLEARKNAMKLISQKLISFR